MSAPPLPPADDAPLPRGERLAALGLLGVLVALRVVLAPRMRVDSDELQHLHLAWGWSVGLVQHRELFDNHMPLFHRLLAPLVRAVGETPDLVTVARLAKLPGFLLTAWATWRLGRATVSRRAAAWGTLLGLATFESFGPSLEVRPDDPWATAWIAGLATVAGGPLRRGRALRAGLAFGLAALLSVKTALLLLGFAAAAVVAWAVDPRVRAAWPVRRALATAGLLAVPGLALAAGLAFVYHRLGALGGLVDDVLRHSYVPGVDPGRAVLEGVAFTVGVAAAGALARRAARRDPDPLRAARRTVVLGHAVGVVLVLETIWVATARQDKLPLVPPLALLAAAALEAGVRRAAAGREARARLVPVALAVAVVATLGRTVHLRSPVRDEGAAVRAWLTEVLALSRPGETVLDPKGQAVYRARPTRLVYERFTRERVARGLLDDTAAADVVAKGTWLFAPALGKYSAKTAGFLAAHTVRAGRVRVAGAVVTAGDVAVTVPVGIPGRYDVVRADGAPFRGTLDGAAWAGPRVLAPGTHAIVVEGGPVQVAVVAADAVARGFRPFAPPAPLEASLAGW